MGGEFENSVVHYINDVIVLLKRCDRFAKRCDGFTKTM